LTYYGVPGIDIPPDTGFQYKEPSEENAHMRPDEYDRLIDDPTEFLFNVWLPRVSGEVRGQGEPVSFRNNLSFLKGGMAMLNYFNAFGTQGERLKTESGTVSAISGILKAPLDILADKLRGYIGLSMDLFERPEKVLAACESLMPHLFHVALSGADPDKNVPVSIWMHLGCVPFISFDQFEGIYWPTLKPIIEEIWNRGHQVLFYAEGDWNAHLQSFAELPEGSIIYHVDKADIFEVHRAIGDRFCLSGGIPNTLLSMGSPEAVRACCKKVIDTVAAEGGYIMDASAIIQNDARVENLRALTDFTREYGVYNGSSSSTEGVINQSPELSSGGYSWKQTRTEPGVCFSWEDKKKELSDISGDESLVRQVWEENEAWAYLYIWHCLLSF